MDEHKERLRSLLAEYSRFAIAIMKEFQDGSIDVSIPKHNRRIVQGDLVGTILDRPLEIEIRKEGPLPLRIAERRDFINRSGGLFVIAETPDEAIRQIKRFLEKLNGQPTL